MAGSDPAAPSYLIVDGHSMVFAWPDLSELHARSQAAARDQLARRLTTLQDLTGERVVLVFDGQRETIEKSEQAIDDIQVFYSPQGATADALIERLVGKYAPDREITVASRDRAVLDTCSALGALAISATALLERVEAAEADLRRRL